MWLFYSICRIYWNVEFTRNLPNTEFIKSTKLHRNLQNSAIFSTKKKCFSCDFDVPFDGTLQYSLAINYESCMKRCPNLKVKLWWAGEMYTVLFATEPQNRLKLTLIYYSRKSSHFCLFMTFLVLVWSSSETLKKYIL